MKALHTRFVLCAGLILGAIAMNPVPVNADPPPAPKKETLVIGKVKVGDSVGKGAAAEGRTNKLDRVSEAMSTEFSAALSGTNKFTLLVGADLNSIMDEHKKDPLMRKESADARVVGDMIPPKYVVVSTIDDFQDVAQKLDQGGNGDMYARDIRLSVVTTIYNINTGEVFQTLNTKVKNRKAVGSNPDVHQTGDAMDAMLLELTSKAAADSAQRVVDVFFPAKVISKIDKTVQINRGDGTNIAKGQVWDAFMQGEDIKDPDTGEVLGKQESPAGKVRITAVFPRYSSGEIIEGTDIDKGTVLRLHTDDDAVKPK